VRRLAELARGFILPFFMGVALSLGAEQDEQDRQGKSQHPCEIKSLVVLANHLDTLGYPNLPFDGRTVPQ